MGHEVDSSAMVWVSGWSRYTCSFMVRISEMASRFSRPPYWLGIHSPAWRE